MSEPVAHWIQAAPPRKDLVLFVHGFCGDALDTWKSFPDLLPQDADLQSYDSCFWGYPTSANPLNIITRLFWSDNPKLGTAGQGLRTLLDNAGRNYGKIVLVGHSMGGLIIQLFILEELRQQRRECLDRITEIVLYGTPSDGLIKASLASLLNGQAADMGWFSKLVTDLRYQWRRMIDDRRADAPQPFRLTLVAGMQDRFVPESSSLGPFPFDEKEIVPGNHTAMVKPGARGDLAYLVLKRRLLRKTPTAEERQTIEGASNAAVAAMNRVTAAAMLCDVDTMVEQARQLLSGDCAMPKVERALGLALLDVERYQESTQLLTRFVNFSMPGDGARPFQSDAQALQQLAIAQSGAGDILGAVASLNSLDERLRAEPETLGILAGRFKRQWLKTGANAQVGRRALALYAEGLAKAKAASNADQVVYNGVNTAYLKFALGDPDAQTVAGEILVVCEAAKPDYWSEASRAECLLLLERYTDSLAAYRKSATMDHAERHWTTTGQQALDILERRGRPAAGAPIADLFQGLRYDFIAQRASNP